LTAKRTFRSGPTASGGTAVRPAWSPVGGWIAFQEPDGIWLVSDAGGNERLLAPIKTKVLGWSIDGGVVYAVPEGENRDRVVSIDVKSGAMRTISTLEPGVRVAADSTSSVILSPSADGKSLLTSVERTRTDIWLLDGLDTRRGWLHRSWW
jgi:Tol biopolymer transport system component